MTHQAQVPAVVAKFYAGTHRPTGDYESHPIIVQAFKPGVGWKRYPIRKRISRTWADKMRREGYTHVGLAMRGDVRRVADFGLTEIIRGG